SEDQCVVNGEREDAKEGKENGRCFQRIGLSRATQSEGSCCVSSEERGCACSCDHGEMQHSPSGRRWRGGRFPHHTNHQQHDANSEEQVNSVSWPGTVSIEEYAREYMAGGSLCR